MTRKAKGSGKTVTVRLTEKEYKALKAIARRMGQSLSATVRNVIRYDIIKYAEKNNYLRVLASDVSAEVERKKLKTNHPSSGSCLKHRSAR
jgi:predicted DNA-binding protein